MLPYACALWLVLAPARASFAAPAGPSAARAVPAAPLSAFGLTPEFLDRLGFVDSERGLLEIGASRWYVGEARERKLRELVGIGAPASARLAAAKRTFEARPLQLRLPERDAPATLDAWFDGGKSRGTAAEPVFAFAPAARPGAGSLRHVALSAPAAKVQPAASAVLAPVAIGGLQSRGAAPELAALLASRLPGAGASDLAVAGTQEAWNLVGRLVERYAGTARLPKAGWEADAVEAYRDAFVGRWGAGNVSVAVTEDTRLFAHRGLWIGDPVLRRPDGSVELLVNLPWMETIAQEGAFADSRVVRVRGALAALEPAERTRLLEVALGGRDPQAMTYGLIYRLAGWMQAELLSAAGGDPSKARGETVARIEGHPVWRAIYEGALNGAVTLTRGLGAGLVHPELWTPANDADVWRLVREANAGSGSAAESLAARLEAEPSLVGYAQYLDLSLEPNRKAARRAAVVAPKACRLSGRLAQAGDAEGIRLFSTACLGAGAQAFLGELSRRSAAANERAAYRAFVEDLLESKGERGFEEMAGRRRLWLAGLAAKDRAGVAALWDASPAGVRRILVAALAGSPADDAAAALAALERERPEAAALRAALPAGSARVERILKRSVEFPAARLEAVGEAQAKRFKAQPQSFVRLLREPEIVAPLLEAAEAGRVDAEYLAAVAFQEGYYLYAARLSEGEKAEEFTSKGPMGIDSFPDLVPTLKRRGFLRQDFDGYRVDGSWTNEANHRMSLARFPDARAALEAMTALIRYKQAQFLADAKAMGLRTDGLSREQLELWTYVYYNFRNPRSVLKGGLASAGRLVGPDHALYGAQRVAATAAYLRDLGLFR